MNVTFLVASLPLFFVATPMYQSVIPPKETSLIAHLVSEANQSNAHSAGDVYLSIKIGSVAYLTELASGQVVDQRKAEARSGGICGEYAEVRLDLLDKYKQETSQGANQVLKRNKGQWKRIALSESDYACDQLNIIPKAIRVCLQVDCN